MDSAVGVVCELMGIDRSALTVELFDRAAEHEEAAGRERRAVGHYYVRDGRAVVGLDVTEASDAAYRPKADRVARWPVPDVHAEQMVPGRPRTPAVSTTPPWPPEGTGHLTAQHDEQPASAQPRSTAGR